MQLFVYSVLELWRLSTAFETAAHMLKSCITRTGVNKLFYVVFQAYPWRWPTTTPCWLSTTRTNSSSLPQNSSPTWKPMVLLPTAYVPLSVCLSPSLCVSYSPYKIKWVWVISLLSVHVCACICVYLILTQVEFISLIDYSCLHYE